jgi:hypothetical protein
MRSLLSNNPATLESRVSDWLYILYFSFFNCKFYAYFTVAVIFKVRMDQHGRYYIHYYTYSEYNKILSNLGKTQPAPGGPYLRCLQKDIDVCKKA